MNKFNKVYLECINKCKHKTSLIKQNDEASTTFEQTNKLDRLESALENWEDTKNIKFIDDVKDILIDLIDHCFYQTNDLTEPDLVKAKKLLIKIYKNIENDKSWQEKINESFFYITVQGEYAIFHTNYLHYIDYFSVPTLVYFAKAALAQGDDDDKMALIRFFVNGENSIKAYKVLKELYKDTWAITQLFENFIYWELVDLDVIFENIYGSLDNQDIKKQIINDINQFIKDKELKNKLFKELNIDFNSDNSKKTNIPQIKKFDLPQNLRDKFSNWTDDQLKELINWAHKN